MTSRHASKPASLKVLRTIKQRVQSLTFMAEAGAPEPTYLFCLQYFSKKFVKTRITFLRGDMGFELKTFICLAWRAASYSKECRQIIMQYFRHQL